MPIPQDAEPLIPLDVKAMAYTLAAIRLCGEAFQAARRAQVLTPTELGDLEQAMACLVRTKSRLLRRPR